MLRSNQHALQEKLEDDRYTNQDFGIFLEKPQGWSLSEEKSLFYDKVVLQPEHGRDSVFIIKTKLPALKRSNDLSRDFFVRLHAQVIKKVLKKIAKGCESVREQQGPGLLGKKTWWIQATYAEGSLKYQISNFLMKHDGKIYGVGYKVHETPDLSKKMAEIKTLIDSVRFLKG